MRGSILAALLSATTVYSERPRNPPGFEDGSDLEVFVTVLRQHYVWKDEINN